MSARHSQGCLLPPRLGGDPVTHSFPVSHALDLNGTRKLGTIEASVAQPVVAVFKLATTVVWTAGGGANTVQVGSAPAGAQLVAAAAPAPNTVGAVSADLVSLVTLFTANTDIYFRHNGVGAAGAGYLMMTLHPLNTVAVT